MWCYNSVIIVAKRQKRNLCKLSKELKLELRKVILFMRDLSAANKTAIISFLWTFLFVFMIRLSSNVNWVVVTGDGWEGGEGGYWLYKVGGKNFHTQTYIFLQIINFKSILNRFSPCIYIWVTRHGTDIIVVLFLSRVQ